MIVSRINNTVVYLDIDFSYKYEIKTILSELGY